MCGRFTLRASPAALREWFPLLDVPEMKPRYNIAPTQQVLAIRRQPELERPACAWLRWGLVPHWADDTKIGQRMINARAESTAQKPAFRSPYRRRRCLIPADGFYEWQKLNKQPFFIGRRDGKPFAFAGLWDHWDKSGEPIDSFTILTTDANELMRPLHDRMPVILASSTYDRWLDPNVQDTALLQELLKPYPSDELTAHPVSTLVNSPKNETPACAVPLPQKG
jgi:putative SOS response-associated peptidase YedK